MSGMEKKWKTGMAPFTAKPLNAERQGLYGCTLNRAELKHMYSVR